MFPLSIKFTVGTHAELARLTAFLEQNTAANQASAPSLGVSANEKAALLGGNDKADTVKEAPGKPDKAATRAATKPTAQASAASQPSSEPVSPTTPPADASAAPAEFEYATLQKAVNAAVPKHGKDKLLAIATAHGAPNFKGLPASAWAAAHADVVALG